MKYIHNVDSISLEINASISKDQVAYLNLLTLWRTWDISLPV